MCVPRGKSHHREKEGDLSERGEKFCVEAQEDRRWISDADAAASCVQCTTTLRLSKCVAGGRCIVHFAKKFL